MTICLHFFGAFNILKTIFLKMQKNLSLEAQFWEKIPDLSEWSTYCLMVDHSGIRSETVLHKVQFHLEKKICVNFEKLPG